LAGEEPFDPLAFDEDGVKGDMGPSGEEGDIPLDPPVGVPLDPPVGVPFDPVNPPVAGGGPV